MPRRGGASRTSSSVPSGARGASTVAAPPTAFVRPAPPAPLPKTAAPAQQTQTQTQTREPGLMGQMAATAGSVAAGSVIGHGISSLLFGGSSSQETAAPVAASQPVQHTQTAQHALNCESQAKGFADCMNTGDLNSCTYYLEMLKQCQAAASPY